MLLGQKLEGGRRIDPDNGLIMPWYTSPCLEWMLTLDLKGKRVFEYGVGDSTLWFRQKGCFCLGVDLSYDWAAKVGAISTSSQIGYINTLSKIVTSSKDFFDIIVIDGDYRDNCTGNALMFLNYGGYLIIDNYKQKSADLEHWPLTEKLIEGMPITIYKEPDHEDWQTAVITKI